MLARKARDTAAKERTDEQKQLLKDHPSLNVSRGSAYLYDRKRVDALNKDFDARQKELQAKRPAEDFVPCLTETPGKIPQTFVFFRGDAPLGTVIVRCLGVLNATVQTQPAIDYALPAIGTLSRRLAAAAILFIGCCAVGLRRGRGR